MGQHNLAGCTILTWFRCVPHSLLCVRPCTRPQAGESLTISVALAPTAAMLQQLAKYVTDPEQGVIELPLVVTVPGQTLPVHVTIRAQLTTSDLDVSPTTLDYGRVPLTESAGQTLTLTNRSRLPQTYSFGGRLPLGVRITPNDGYGHLAPGQSVPLLVSFRPPISGVQYFDLAVKTLAGRTWKVEGRAEGCEPPVTLSHNNIQVSGRVREGGREGGGGSGMEGGRERAREGGREGVSGRAGGTQNQSVARGSLIPVQWLCAQTVVLRGVFQGVGGLKGCGSSITILVR